MIYRKKKFLNSTLFILCFYVLWLISSDFQLVNSTPESFSYNGAIPIEDQFCISHSPTQWDYHADNLAVLGPNIVRNNIEWFTVSYMYGKEAMMYDWTYYDNLFSGSTSRGIENLGCFVYGWGWWPNNYALPREDWPYYIHFAGEFCQRYKDVIYYYETWNEPNIGFWTLSDEDFFEFQSLLIDTIRGNDSTCFIISPGIVGPDVKYLEKMILHYGVDEFNSMFDGIAYHAYSGRNTEYLYQRMFDVKQLLEKYNLNEKPIWITEIGLATNLNTQQQFDSFYEDYLEFQADTVIKTYAESIDYNISSIFWYCHLDWCDTGFDYGEGRFGLMYCYDPSHYLFEFKPSGYAYHMFNRLIDNGIYYPNGIQLDSPFSDKIYSYYYYTPRNTTILVIWSTTIANMATISFQPNENLPNEPINTKCFNLDYYSNSSSYIGSNNLFNFKLGIKPLMLEFDYTDIFNDNSLDPQPLTMIVKIKIETKSIIFLIGIPVLISFVSLSMIQRNSKVENLKEKRELKNIKKDQEKEAFKQ